jgi:DNA-binding MarR family transcriptional regulator
MTSELGTAAHEPGAQDATVVAARLRFSVTRLARLLRQQDTGGLAPTLGAALASIEREGPVTLGALASIEQMAPPSITKVVGKLEAAGLVVRRPDAKDRRICRVEITAKGRKQLDANRTRRTAWLATRLHDLSADDLARLTAAAVILEDLAAAPVEPRP